MSGITLAQAQAQLDALMVATASQSLTVHYGDRTVTYRSADDLIKLITFWERRVVELTNAAAGVPRHNIKLADFRSCE
jgi:hypothetical protein